MTSSRGEKEKRRKLSRSQIQVLIILRDHAEKRSVDDAWCGVPVIAFDRTHGIPRGVNKTPWGTLCALRRSGLIELNVDDREFSWWRIGALARITDAGRAALAIEETASKGDPSQMKLPMSKDGT